MHTYSLEEARKIIINCSKLYETNLNGKDYLVIYREHASNVLKYIKIQFHDINFQHLTGIELLDKNGTIRKNVASLFYHKCIKNKLRKDEICFRKDGTTHLKLTALPVIMNIQKVTKIAGDFNNNRTYLVADKIIGNINFCLGLKELDNGSYAPVSALLEDIKKLTFEQSQVIAIFSKNTADNIYQTVRYVAKGINLNTVTIPNDIKTKISLEKYVPNKNTTALTS